nr:reverse transcriptase domain-containing protein [Tanacetum cinerariifolium]
MHSRASNYELVEPLLEPERTLNRRRHRRNRRVPYDQRNNPPQHQKFIYPPILDINHFLYFLVILGNLYPMDDDPMWAGDRVVALSPGSAITILETANEFAIKGNALKLPWSQSVQRQYYQDLLSWSKRDNPRSSECHIRNIHGSQNPTQNRSQNHQASIQNLEIKFDRLADKKSGRSFSSLPRNTQPNLKGQNSKAYQPPQSRNEHVNVVFTRSGKPYNPPVNPNDQQNNFENPINFVSDEEDEEPTPQPKTQNPKQVKQTPFPKPYKPKIPYPQCLRKEKMEAQYGKFLDMIRVVRINVLLIDVIASMLNYGKFLTKLISNKHKIKQISFAFLSDESSAMIQNKVPPKLEDPGSFLIPCRFNKTFSCNALADLGASINLMPYSLYAKLSFETLKPTKMSMRLADRSFQYPIGIAKNMLVEVGKFTFPADFIILKMEEDNRVPLILGRPFLHTADAVVKSSIPLKEPFSRKKSLLNLMNSWQCLLIKTNSESNTKEPSSEKITINTDYKIKTSLEEPRMNLKLKPLPDNLEYVFLEEPFFLHVIISSQLSKEKKNKHVSILNKHKQAFA